jgi:protein-tyrosine phosphatase
LTTASNKAAFLARIRQVARVLRHRVLREDFMYEWARRRRGHVDLPPGEIRRIVVICHGNICRSPFAGQLLARKREDLEVRGAGLAAREGKPAEPGAREAARRFGLDLEEHAAHRLDAGDVSWGDLILGMQGRHAREFARRWPEAAPKFLLLGDFLPAPPFAIEDPWGKSDTVFDATFHRIALAVDSLSERLPLRTDPQ